MHSEIYISYIALNYKYENVKKKRRTAAAAATAAISNGMQGIIWIGICIHFLGSFHKCDADVFNNKYIYLHETAEQVNGKCYAHDFCVYVQSSAHAF